MEKGSDSEDELVRDLLDDESPFFLLSQGTVNSGEDVVNKQLVPNVYSGPRIQDIEDALSVSNRKDRS
ncbi:hypothetical protein HRI_000646100 [Hibiscus trionum]|uniref:Uncharacterized protein n=1 Tax=Hibiscus trionum TaxID=183268 RepID=A0A9W7LM45_HIBTR|nr:hypothetical protein HRI_000646100 [Hibiscus trionum]